MTQKANVIIALEIFLAVLYLSSAVVLSRGSSDFILARHGPTVEGLFPGQTIHFAAPLGKQAVFLGDWWAPEDWGVWMRRARAELALKPPTVGALFLAVSARFVVPNSSQRLGIAFDGKRVASLTIHGPAGIVNCSWTTPLPPANRDLSVILFDVEQQASAADIGAGTDERSLGFGLETLSFAAASAPPSCDGGAVIEPS